MDCDRVSFDPLGLAGRDASSLTNLMPVSTSREAAAVTDAPSRDGSHRRRRRDRVDLPTSRSVGQGRRVRPREGRIISLAHPVAMGGCFLATLYAGYTGLQWRMLRELGVELKEAKAAASAAQKAVQEHAGAGASDEEALAPPPPSLVQAASDADATVAALTEKRSVIQAGNFRDRHYQLGTILLAVGIPMALEGPVNTYMRAGKLFPGPHVYAGVGVASFWAIAAALVPEMQKGKEWARTAHIGVNAVTFGLFAYYQIPTGLEIAAKVIEKTKFPAGVSLAPFVGARHVHVALCALPRCGRFSQSLRSD